jgi:hypothetical protein
MQWLHVSAVILTLSVVEGEGPRRSLLGHNPPDLSAHTSAAFAVASSRANQNDTNS